MPDQQIQVDPSQVQPIPAYPAQAQPVVQLDPSQVQPDQLTERVPGVGPGETSVSIPIPPASAEERAAALARFESAPSVPLYNYPEDANGQRSTQLQPIKPVDKPLEPWEKVLMAPLDYLGEGMQQLGQGLAGIQHPQSPKQVAGATSDVIRGGMQTFSPFFVPEMAAKPLASLTGMLTFGGAQQGIEQTAKYFGLPGGYAKLAGDIGGLVGGVKAHNWLADMAKIPDTRIADGIYQNLEARVAALQDPTLTPDQRAANLAGIHAMLYSLRQTEGWKIPFTGLFRNPNQAERQAYNYMRGLGAPPNVGVASGSPIMKGAQYATGMTPAGAYMDVGIKRQTLEALRQRSSELVREALPAEGPAEDFYNQAWNAVNQSKPVNVPLRLAGDGSQITGDIKGPVDLREIKADMYPLWKQLQFMPAKEQSASYAYSALKVLMNEDDHIEPQTAEQGLSGLKNAARTDEGGLAKSLNSQLIPKLQAAINSAVQQAGGNDAMTALQSGRRAAAKEFGAEWLAKQFDLAQQEGGFGHGRQLWNNWVKLPESSKKTMYRPDQVAEFNKLFHGLRMWEDNPNPSGTALVGALMAQAGYAAHGGVVDPWFWLSQLGMTGASKLLRSDLGVKLLSEGMRIPRTSARGRYVEKQLKSILADTQRTRAGGRTRH